MQKQGDYLKLSIVTVVYNSVHLLEKTLVSVLEQSYGNVEFIVVDGGSTDGTVELIRRYESRLSKWISEPDNGIYHAMNKGAKMVTGEWVCFLNSGDVFIDDNILQKVSEGIVAVGDADVVYGNILLQGKNGGLWEKVAGEPGNFHRMYFCHQSAFVRTDLLRKYSFDVQHKMSADFKFFKESYLRKDKLVHLKFPVVIYDSSGISNTAREKGLMDNIAVIREMDKGWQKLVFLVRLYFVIFWSRLTKKTK